MKTIRCVSRYIIASLLVMISSFSISQEQLSSEDISIKITDIQVGFIRPSNRHGSGRIIYSRNRLNTNLERHYDEREMKISKYFEAKQEVAIGAKFKINSSLGKKLQIVSVVTALSSDKGFKNEKYVTLDVVTNDGVFSNWQHVKSKKDKSFSQWHFQFLLCAIDEDIISRVEDIDYLRNAIKIYETTIFKSHS